MGGVTTHKSVLSKNSLSTRPIFQINSSRFSIGHWPKKLYDPKAYQASSCAETCLLSGPFHFSVPYALLTSREGEAPPFWGVGRLCHYRARDSRDSGQSDQYLDSLLCTAMLLLSLWKSGPAIVLRVSAVLSGNASSRCRGCLCPALFFSVAGALLPHTERNRDIIKKKLSWRT